MSVNDDRSNVLPVGLPGLDQRHPHLQLTNSTQMASTAADTMMSHVARVDAPSDSEPNADKLLHLPVIPVVAATTFNIPCTDTESRSLTLVAAEPAWTGSTNCDRLLSVDRTNYRSKRDVCGGNELVRVVDETHRTSPRPAEHVRDRHRQSGFYCDDERVIRNQMSRIIRKASVDNLSKTFVPFRATKYETRGETQYPAYVPEPRLYRYGLEVSVNSITAAGNGKNRMSGKFYNRIHNITVRPPHCLTQSQLVKTAGRQINARQMDPRHKQPFLGKTSAAADSDSGTVNERQRVLDWLDSVNDAGQPPSPDIDDSSTPTQTDTAIHIVYDRD